MLMRSFRAADRAQFALDREAIEAVPWQRQHPVDALAQHFPYRLEDPAPLELVARSRCRIRYAPVRADRMAGPDRANLSGGVVANGDDDIHRRRAGPGELVPALAAQRRAVAELLRQLRRDRLHRAAGKAAGTEGAETALTKHVEHGLGHHAARGVARAQEQYVARAWRHCDQDLALRRGFACAVAISFCRYAMPSSSGKKATTSATLRLCRSCSARNSSRAIAMRCAAAAFLPGGFATCCFSSLCSRRASSSWN